MERDFSNAALLRFGRIYVALNHAALGRAAWGVTAVEVEAERTIHARADDEPAAFD